MTTEVEPSAEDYNGWADFWRNDIGINVVPWNKGEGRSNKIWWKDYQYKPVPQEQHDHWKRTDAFKDGIARIPGICWHKKPFNPRLRWWDADVDKQSAIDAICTMNGKKTTIEELSKIFIVEGHEDDRTRLHICGYYESDKPCPHIPPGNICELKCDGTHGIVRCTNSLHYFEEKGKDGKGTGKFIERGHRYGIIGTNEPTIGNWFVEHILGVCALSVNDIGGNKASLASTLWKDGATVNEGENRHGAMLSLMDSLLIKFPNENREVIFQMAMAKNRLLCKAKDGKDIAPIPESELRKMFDEQCVKFARKKLVAEKEKRKYQRVRQEQNNTTVSTEPPEETGIELDDKVIEGLSSLLSKFEEGLLYKIFSFFHRHEISLASCIHIIDTITTDQEERRYRRNILEQIFNDTYPDSDIKNITSKHILDALTIFYSKSKANHGTAKKVFTLIITWLIQEDPIIWLRDALMRENTFATMDDSDDIYYYNGEGVFVKGGNVLIKKQIELIFPSATTYQVNETVNHIRRSTYVNRSDFDTDIDILNTEDCALNLHTLEVKPHSPDYLSLVKIPVKYDPQARCPKISEFFSQVVEPEYIPVIIQMIGYCLYKTWIYQKSFMLYGRTGSNGKGVLLSVIEALLGRHNCSHRSLQDLDKNRFATADLYGKFANIFGDLKSSKLAETGNFKVMAAGDAVSAEHKFAQPFTFRNYAKMIFSANLIPESEDKTDAYYRRWVIIRFNKRFADGKEDAELTKKLTTSEELSGLLNLALKGLHDLIAEGGFHHKTIEEIKQEYEENTSDVNAFLIQECVVDTSNPEYRILTDVLYASYVNLCNTRRVLPFEKSVFGKELAKHGIHSSQHWDSGVRDTYYLGVILRSSLRKPGQASL